MKLIKKVSFKIPLRGHARLKGLIFQKICNAYVEQKYCNIFCYKAKRFGAKWLTKPAMDVKEEDTVQLTVGFASDDEKVVDAIRVIKWSEDMEFLPMSKKEWREKEFKLRQITPSQIEKAEKILDLEKEYFKNYSFGDFVVFQEAEIHVYEFKSGKRPTFTTKEKDEIQKLKRDKMNVKIFILTSNFFLPKEYEIVEYEN